jgi:hypothetical protein
MPLFVQSAYPTPDVRNNTYVKIIVHTLGPSPMRHLLVSDSVPLGGRADIEIEGYVGALCSFGSHIASNASIHLDHAALSSRAVTGSRGRVHGRCNIARGELRKVLSRRKRQLRAPSREVFHLATSLKTTWVRPRHLKPLTDSPSTSSFSGALFSSSAPCVAGCRRRGPNSRWSLAGSSR